MTEVHVSSEYADSPSQEETRHMRGRSNYWKRLKKKWNRRGVVEIDVDHQSYNMMECVREGLEDVLVSHTELGPKEDLTDEDYSHVLHAEISSPSGKVFHFYSYASSVFATLRQAIGLSEETFLNSIAPKGKAYLEFISNSKSGQCFYLSNDKAYFMKTDKKSSIDFLMNILGEYLEHFLHYPHSLLVKYLGLFSVKVDGEMKYFYVMQSIFYPDERIERRYDVKGCLAGRYQKPAEPDDNVIQVLKDQNFLSEHLDIGQERDWFVRQIRHDADFLKTLGVQDYSLLVGLQRRQADEKTQDLGDIVQRVQQSVPQLKHKAKPKDQSHAEPEEVEMTHLKIPENDHENQNSNNSKPKPRKRPTLGFGSSLSFIKREVTDAFGGQNRRLLPKGGNSLHIIDGPEYRYFLGIVDFFTLYECRQKVGRLVKNVKFCCGDHSTVPPPVYADRFVEFIVDHTDVEI